MTSIYAVYRPFYGEDFIKESILSILPHVDKVYFCYSDVPFGHPLEGVPIKVNEPLDGCLKIVQDLCREDLTAASKIVIRCQQGVTPRNQFSKIIKEFIPDLPDIMMCMEPDQVWHEEELKKAINEVKAGEGNYFHAQQIECWRVPDWRIPLRPHRTGVTFWKDVKEVPDTKTQGEPVKGEVRQLDAKVHNFGFCVDPRNMLNKHQLALLFSATISDSQPNPTWLHEKWLPWHPITNNKDLEISKGHEHTIPKAIPYNRDEFPKLIKEKFGYEV